MSACSNTFSLFAEHNEEMTDKSAQAKPFEEQETFTSKNSPKALSSEHGHSGKSTNSTVQDECANGPGINDSSWFISNEMSEGLVLFSSHEGRQIFFETANAGYLNSYFELSQNFLTSFDPKFSCGLATLTMCLNTFREDPCRVWRDIYRWYAQTMLEHCVPYRIIVGNGIVFQQFACMAECNYLTVGLVRHVKPTASIEEFRVLCKKTTAGSCEEILVVCYHRIGLDQEGTGHFSPIGGYHPEKDLVLVFDISRYKYPLHWVPITRLWKAMELNDDVTGKPRGYFILRKRSSQEKPALLFKTVSPEDSPTFHRGWLKFFSNVLMPWYRWMQSFNAPSSSNDTLIAIIPKLLHFMTSSKCTGIGHLDGIHIRLEFAEADPSYHKKCLVCTVREAIEDCSLWKYVRQQITELHDELNDEQNQIEHQKQKHNHHLINPQHTICLCWSMEIDQVTKNKLPESSSVMCCNVNIQPSSCHLRQFNLAHYVVMILLSWPYDMDDRNNNTIDTGICSTMNSFISTELSNACEVLKDEVVNVRKRFLMTQCSN